MSSGFEELDYRQTPLGELILRRRRSPALPDEPVYEVKLDGVMLMSSTVNEGERALARLALAARPPGAASDVLVGGLGLGYTAAAALEDPDVRRVDVIELLAPVIGWHRRGLVPMAGRLMDDPRCTLIEADFFAELAPEASTGSRRRYDVILLDIDHSPDSWLRARHEDFYTDAGLRSLAGRLAPDGVFGLWSASAPDTLFLELLGNVFAGVQSHDVAFRNPHLSTTDTNWVIVATGPLSAGVRAGS